MQDYLLCKGEDRKPHILMKMPSLISRLLFVPIVNDKKIKK